MSAKYLGAHMPTGKGLGNAVREGKKIGCTAVQVFTSSPQTWRAKAITDDMVADFRAALAETGIDRVVSHDSYLVNLCAADEDKREQSRQGLGDELKRCARYGIGYVVSHMGAHVGAGTEAGLAMVAESAKIVLDKAPEGVMLLMETTAGQGSSLNANFEEIAWLLREIDHPQLGVCLDTCHIFAAGYDIRTAETFHETFAKFEATVGFQHLKSVHCNDSAKPFGSRKDRHAHIGEGEIGIEAFRLLVNDVRFTEIPILLETPDAETDHARNLATLQSLIGN